MRPPTHAGVKLWFEKLDGRDPKAFIVSVNLERRNLTKGQQVMALPMIYTKPEKGGRGKNPESREGPRNLGLFW